MRTFTDEAGTVVASELTPEWRKLNAEDVVQIGEERLAMQFLRDGQESSDPVNVIWTTPLTAIDVLNDPVPPLGAVRFGTVSFHRINGTWVAMRLTFPHGYKSGCDAD